MPIPHEPITRCGCRSHPSGASNPKASTRACQEQASQTRCVLDKGKKKPKVNRIWISGPFFTVRRNWALDKTKKRRRKQEIICQPSARRRVACTHEERGSARNSIKQVRQDFAGHALACTDNLPKFRRQLWQGPESPLPPKPCSPSGGWASRTLSGRGPCAHTWSNALGSYSTSCEAAAARRVRRGPSMHLRAPLSHCWKWRSFSPPSLRPCAATDWPQHSK